MAFLTDEDYKSLVKDEILNTLLGGQISVRLDAERKAQAQITSALNLRYDVPNIFNKTGDNRNAEIVMIMVDLVLYHVHSRITPGQIPSLRNDRYVDAKGWLKDVAKGLLQPDLPVPAGEDTGTKNDVQYGSRPARNPYF